jgi:8-oxo-dGTP diphosphatase
MPIPSSDHPLSLKEYPRPALAVDLILFMQIKGKVCILLLKRDQPPFKDCWALPGSFVHIPSDLTGGEHLEQTAHRILKDKIHLSRDFVYLEQLYTFSNPHRDPRMRVLSVAYYALIPEQYSEQLQLEVKEAQWWCPLSSLSEFKNQLAFDHYTLIQSSIKRIADKSEYLPLLFKLLPPLFTLPDIRTIYEAFGGEVLDPSNFRRRCKRWVTDGLLEETNHLQATGSRPARLYTIKHLPIDPFTN